MPLPPLFPEIRALDLFATVVAVGSLSKAADVHGVSQPSASARIRHLERQLGVTLLQRSPTGSTPTPVGQLIAGWSAKLLEAAHELRRGVEALEARDAGRLRVSASFTIAELLLPRWLGQLMNRHPDASVELAVANSTEVLRAVREGTVDVGFIESPDDVDDLESVAVGHDELVAVVPPGHPWTHEGIVDPDTLARTPLVLREPASGTRQFLEQALKSAGLPPATAALELGSTAAVKNAVATSRLPGVLSRLAVAADADAGVLAVVPVTCLDLRRTLLGVVVRSRPCGPSVTSLLELAAVP